MFATSATDCLAIVKKNTKLTVPYVKCNKIPNFVDQRLDQLSEHNLLTWHDGGRRIDHIWIKLGADHGKSLLKFTLEVANVHSPNAAIMIHIKI